VQYWLMKSEPSVYSIQDFQRDGHTGWEGIRNYQARNLMRDQMCVGDPVLFYHSSTEPPGVAGLARVSATGLVDPTQFDTTSPYYDAKATPAEPRWLMVELAYLETWPEFLPLSLLKAQPQLAGLMLLQRGSRLSIQPVSKTHFQAICKLGKSQQVF